jgi:hypothetical protein
MTNRYPRSSASYTGQTPTTPMPRRYPGYISGRIILREPVVQEGETNATGKRAEDCDD